MDWPGAKGGLLDRRDAVDFARPFWLGPDPAATARPDRTVADLARRTAPVRGLHPDWRVEPLSADERLPRPPATIAEIDAAARRAAARYWSSRPLETGPTLNQRVRRLARSTPVGALLDDADPATNATLAPLLNWLFSPENRLEGATWRERFERSRALQQADDQAYDRDNPDESATLDALGGLAALGATARLFGRALPARPAPLPSPLPRSVPSKRQPELLPQQPRRLPGSASPPRQRSPWERIRDFDDLVEAERRRREIAKDDAASKLPARKAPADEAPVVITGDEVVADGWSVPVHALVNAVRDLAEEQFAGRVVSIGSDNTDVYIPRSGIKHALSGRVSREKALVMARLDQLIARSRLLSVQEDNRGRPAIIAAYQYITPVTIRRVQRNVVIIVRQLRSGARFYDHFVIE